jgi:toxin HigB-1
MIKTFKHKGLREFFENGSKAGINASHASKLRLMLSLLDKAKDEADMNVGGWGLHPLSGDLKNHWSVSVSGNWRMTFRFEGEDAVLVNYQDYH